jgi:hypothetical protein
MAVWIRCIPSRRRKLHRQAERSDSIHNGRYMARVLCLHLEVLDLGACRVQLALDEVSGFLILSQLALDCQPLFLLLSQGNLGHLPRYRRHTLIWLQ